MYILYIIVLNIKLITNLHALSVAIHVLSNRGTWGVLGGQTFKSQGKLSNGWTDWHQLWFTSADSSGNGHSIG